MQQRYYDPQMGRFLSPDPVPFMINQPKSFSRFSYAADNPLTMRDPDGRYFCRGDACDKVDQAYADAKTAVSAMAPGRERRQAQKALDAIGEKDKPGANYVTGSIEGGSAAKYDWQSNTTTIDPSKNETIPKLAGAMAHEVRHQTDRNKNRPSGERSQYRRLEKAAYSDQNAMLSAFGLKIPDKDLPKLIEFSVEEDMKSSTTVVDFK